MPQTITQQASKSPENIGEAFFMMATSLQIIYTQFQLYFHLFFLVIIAYLFYILGKASVFEPIANQVNALERTIQKNQHNRLNLPRRIEESRTKRKYSRILLVMSLIASFIAISYTKVQIDKLYLYIGIGLIAIYCIYSEIKYKILISRQKTLSEQEKSLRENILNLSTSLGPKVQQSLKNKLCKDKLLSRKSPSSQTCQKNQCKEFRGALKGRYEALKFLTESALNFQWCSICKKRQSFDELVKYEPKVMPNIPTDDQDTEVTLRIKYMLTLLQSIDHWVKEASPCNCSKLYIDQIITNKKKYSQISKPLSQKIKHYEQTQKLNQQKKLQSMKKTQINKTGLNYQISDKK